MCGHLKTKMQGKKFMRKNSSGKKGKKILLQLEK